MDIGHKIGYFPIQQLIETPGTTLFSIKSTFFLIDSSKSLSIDFAALCDLDKLIPVTEDRVEVLTQGIDLNMYILQYLYIPTLCVVRKVAFHRKMSNITKAAKLLTVSLDKLSLCNYYVYHFKTLKAIMLYSAKMKLMGLDVFVNFKMHLPSYYLKANSSILMKVGILGVGIFGM